MLSQLMQIEHKSAAACMMISSLARKCLTYVVNCQHQHWHSVCLADYVAARLVLYQFVREQIFVNIGRQRQQRAFLKHFSVRAPDDQSGHHGRRKSGKDSIHIYIASLPL